MDVSDTEGLQIYTSQKRNCIFVYSENLQILHRAFPILMVIFNWYFMPNGGYCWWLHWSKSTSPEQQLVAQFLL